MKIQKIAILNIILGLIYLLPSCKNDDGPAITILTIEVVNESAQLVSDAEVKVFSSQQDFLDDTSVLFEGTTDEAGQVVFKNIEKTKVFVSVQKNNSTNWSGDPQITILPGTHNTSKINLTTSFEHFLVGKQSKTWKLTDLIIDGTSLILDIDECETDNLLIYEKTGKIGYQDNGSIKCNNTEKDVSTFQWELLNDEKDLIISYDDLNEEQSISIIELTASTLRGDVLIDFEGTPLPAEFVYKSQ